MNCVQFKILHNSIMSSSCSTISKLLKIDLGCKKNISFKDQFKKIRQQPNSLDGDSNSKFTQKDTSEFEPTYEATLEFYKDGIRNTDEGGAFLFMIAYNDVKKVNIIVGEYTLVDEDMVLLKGISRSTHTHNFYTLTFDKHGKLT